MSRLNFCASSLHLNEYLDCLRALNNKPPQNRLNEENQSLSKKQAAFQRNSSRDNDPAAEEEFEKFCEQGQYTEGVGALPACLNAFFFPALISPHSLYLSLFMFFLQLCSRLAFWSSGW
jgi:hypothetical protein